MVNRSSRWLNLLEILEKLYLPKGPVTSYGAKRISFLKFYIKYFPAIVGILAAGLIAWGIYSGKSSVLTATLAGIFVGALVYAGARLSIWLFKKFFISNIDGYQQIIEPKNIAFNENKSYWGLRVFWIIIVVLSVWFVAGVLYHYRGFPGLSVAILIYLPSVSIIFLLMERAMEGHSFIPTKMGHRLLIITAAILVQIFFLWWIIEIFQGLWGWPGTISAVVLFFIYQYWYITAKKKQLKTT